MLLCRWVLIDCVARSQLHTNLRQRRQSPGVPCCPPRNFYLRFWESGVCPARGCRMWTKLLPEAGGGGQIFCRRLGSSMGRGLSGWQIGHPHRGRTRRHTEVYQRRGTAPATVAGRHGRHFKRSAALLLTKVGFVMEAFAVWTLHNQPCVLCVATTSVPIIWPITRCNVIETCVHQHSAGVNTLTLGRFLAPFAGYRPQQGPNIVSTPMPIT